MGNPQWLELPIARTSFPGPENEVWLGVWITLSGSKYSCLEQISMVPSSTESKNICAQKKMPFCQLLSVLAQTSLGICAVWSGSSLQIHRITGYWRIYSEPSLQRQHLFRKLLPLKWICCCKESLMSRLICKKGLVVFLFPHGTYVSGIC